jgi:hypothetical protein
MPGKSRKMEGHEQAAEELKKSGEDLERAARDLNRKMGAGEEKGKRPSKPQKAEARESGRQHAATEQPKGKKAPETRGTRWIDSVEDHEEHAGQSLSTKNHEVIMRWAEERKAQPATVEGTEHEGRPGVLRFDFPGYAGELKAISWDEWFKTFDSRDLTFLYQEHLKNGNQSNFFKLTSPHREDG